jgi:FolB domain-containing protein
MTDRFSDETIHLVNLRVDCIVGVNAAERVREQPLIVTASLRRDFGPAAAAEDLAATLDYALVAQAIRDFVRQGRFHLLETLVRRLAEHLAQRFGLQELELHVRKPLAIAESDGAAVSLKLTQPPVRP